MQARKLFLRARWAVTSRVEGGILDDGSGALDVSPSALECAASRAARGGDVALGFAHASSRAGPSAMIYLRRVTTAAKGYDPKGGARVQGVGHCRELRFAPSFTTIS